MPSLSEAVLQAPRQVPSFAEKGHDVLILEKEKFPRYHIGESLMPYCYFPLERLGVVDQLMESACPRKYCVQFVRQDGSLHTALLLFPAYGPPCLNYVAGCSFRI